MLFLLLAPFAFAPLAVRPLAAAWRAAASRDRFHAAVELRTEPHRIALRRAAARGDCNRRCVRRRALSALRASGRALRARGHAALQRYGAAAGSLAVRRRLESVRARRRDSRERPRRVACGAATKALWAVAAANPNVRLDPRPDPHFARCPAYDTNAAAFFASLAGRMPPHLCGGVPVAP